MLKYFREQLYVDIVTIIVIRRLERNKLALSSELTRKQTSRKLPRTAEMITRVATISMPRYNY